MRQRFSFAFCCKRFHLLPKQSASRCLLQLLLGQCFLHLSLEEKPEHVCCELRQDNTQQILNRAQFKVYQFMHMCLEPGYMPLHLSTEIWGFHLGVTQTQTKSIFSFTRHLLLMHLYSNTPNIITGLLRC